MTNQRFTIREYETKDGLYAIDVICDNGIELPNSTACDVLNELNNENIKLKQELNETLRAYENKTVELRELQKTIYNFNESDLRHWQQDYEDKGLREQIQ